MKPNKTLATAKSLPIAAIIFSMMIFPANANAFPFLDIVLGFVGNTIKTVVMTKAAKEKALNALTENKPDNQVLKPGTQPPPEDIFAALSKLEGICMQEFVSHVPCGIGSEESYSIGQARTKAIKRATVELAGVMGTYVSANAEFKDTSGYDDGGVLKEVSTYIANAKLSTEQLVVGAQPYLTYVYIDEEATQRNKGRITYIATTVVVLNKDLFRKALEDAAKDRPLGEQIIKESKKGIVDIIKSVLKRK